MADNAPVVIEFGKGACTCSGMYTGCAVCTTASILIRYGKPIPRYADGTPDMRTLGARMGRRHRNAVAGNRHGLSLSGTCSPPHTGTNWCAYCIYLELKAAGLPAGYGQLSDVQIANHLKAGHSLGVPGLYARVPLVDRNSYSGSTPARGRSDGNFDSWHMVGAHGVTMADSQIVNVIITDSDFGSTGRPIIPPHSLWSWTVFLRYYHAAGWGVVWVNAKPPTATPPPPAVKYEATVPAGDFFRYFVNSEGVILRRSDPALHTGGFSAACTPRATHHWPDQHRSVSLVKLLSGSRKGQYIGQRYSNQP